jgi:teichuronic acid biosynthesis glycosyltransferase TuaC
MRVLMITSEWPTPARPYWARFIVQQVEFLQKSGVDIDVIAFRGAKNPINYVRAWYRVHRRLQQSPYDLIHAQWAQSALTALPTRLPLVVTFRGGETDGIVGPGGKCTVIGRILRFVSWIVATRADELVLVSGHMRRHLPQRSFHIVPSGLDFSRLPLISQDAARKQLGLPASKRLVLFVGNPAEPLKRYAFAREIVSRLNSEAELVLAWGVPHDEIPVYMNACDALLVTSVYEGSPNVVKEALACNLPIVSVAVGDIPDRLNGVAGCSVHPDNDPDRIAAALATVLQRKERTNSRPAVRDLDENILARRMTEIYRKAASKGEY